MTESKHKHARVREDRPRTSRGRIVLVVVLVLGALATYWFLAGGGEKQVDPSDALAAAAGTRSAGSTEWIAKDGYAYRMTVASSEQFVNVASASGCITVPPPGTTNLQFTVLIENRSPTAAPVPALEFAANLTDAGVVDTRLTSFAKASKRIELLPIAAARTCEESSRISPAGREKIEPGSIASFTGTLAGVKTPLGDGLSLIVRFLKADAGSRSGASPALVMVPVTR